MRDYIPNYSLKIDGRNIPYTIVTARDYLLRVGLIDESEDSFEDFVEKNYEVYQRISQIIGLKNSIFLLSRTTHSCQSITDNLKILESELWVDLKDNYNFEVLDEVLEELNI